MLCSNLILPSAAKVKLSKPNLDLSKTFNGSILPSGESLSSLAGLPEACYDGALRLLQPHPVPSPPPPSPHVPATCSICQLPAGLDCGPIFPLQLPFHLPSLPCILIHRGLLLCEAFPDYPSTYSTDHLLPHVPWRAKWPSIMASRTPGTALDSPSHCFSHQARSSWRAGGTSLLISFP